MSEGVRESGGEAGEGVSSYMMSYIDRWGYLNIEIS